MRDRRLAEHRRRHHVAVGGLRGGRAEHRVRRGLPVGDRDRREREPAGAVADREHVRRASCGCTRRPSPRRPARAATPASVRPRSRVSGRRPTAEQHLSRPRRALPSSSLTRSSPPRRSIARQRAPAARSRCRCLRELARRGGTRRRGRSGAGSARRECTSSTLRAEPVEDARELERDVAAAHDRDARAAAPAAGTPDRSVIACSHARDARARSARCRSRSARASPLSVRAPTCTVCGVGEHARGPSRSRRPRPRARAL